MSYLYTHAHTHTHTGVPASGEGEREGENERSSETEGDHGTCSCVCNKIVMPTKLLYRLYVHVSTVILAIIIVLQCMLPKTRILS